MIIEKPLKYIGRAGNLAWLGFGEYVTTINHKGIQRKIAQYTLHIQCPFRITQTEKKIICAGILCRRIFNINSIAVRLHKIKMSCHTPGQMV